MKKQKINWKEFTRSKKDFVSIEHIFPQNLSNPYWKKLFLGYSKKEKELLCNSLGNLLPLSIQKNSSLQDDSFEDKKKRKEGSVGYIYGSYSENEVANENENWGPNEILKRGLKLINFLEKRWAVNFGNEIRKIEILHLNFLDKKK